MTVALPMTRPCSRRPSLPHKRVAMGVRLDVGAVREIVFPFDISRHNEVLQNVRENLIDVGLRRPMIGRPPPAGVRGFERRTSHREFDQSPHGRPGRHDAARPSPWGAPIGPVDTDESSAADAAGARQALGAGHRGAIAFEKGSRASGSLQCRNV